MVAFVPLCGMESNNADNKITIYAANDESFEIDSNALEVLQESITIKEMLEDCGVSQGINLVPLTKKQLEKVFDYLEDIHSINEAKKKGLQKEVENHLETVLTRLQKEPIESLITLMKDANYLAISLLVDLCCEAIMDWLQQDEQLKSFKDDTDFCKKISIIFKRSRKQNNSSVSKASRKSHK